MQKIKASSQSLVVTRSYYGLLALLLGARTLLGTIKLLGSAWLGTDLSQLDQTKRMSIILSHRQNGKERMD